MSRFPALALVVLSVAGCGGDSSSSSQSDYQNLVEQAAAKQAQAESLGVPSPCNAAQQCGLLEFQHADGQCLSQSYQVYSLVSATAAAASAAAGDEQALAIQASQAAPPSTCPAIIIARPPQPSCAANTCTAS